ncbi:sensor histidine kinase [Halostella litorea]|uniref:sensor histidine kinase n=1 Tax=Halostella litorea TaxID=2528831 RepID=UPI001091A8B0|nr:histidine kinase N-terminal 7TM domain-containing protein [Halostella litorea]
MTIGVGTVRAVYAVATVTTVTLGYVVWRHREERGALPLLGSIAGGAWWSGSLFLATVSNNYATSVLLNRALYVGVVAAVASIALFALEYTGRAHLITRRTVALLAVHPLLVVALAFANPGDVFFASIAPAPSAPTGVAVEWGPAFWAHVLYSYAVTLFVAVFVFEMVFRSRSLYRGQVLVLTAAVLSPAFANLPNLLDVVPFDTTPIGFLAANLLFTVAITRYELIDLMPIARERVLDTVEDAVYVVDRDGRIVDANPAGRDLADRTGTGPDVVGRDAEEVLSGMPKFRDLFRRAVETGEDRANEFEFEDRHYAVEASTIEDGRDRHVGWLFLVRDVTERERREAELRRRNEQLDEFANIVSHDLRNPLNVADGYVGLARESGDVSHLDGVEEALDRMEAIVEDVLALARDGGEVADPMPVDLRAVAEAAWGDVDTGDGRLRVADDATVDADRPRLVRLLENLFRNAVEHGAPDEPITVTVGVLPSGTGFYVADDGRGIPESERGQVFDSGHTTAEDGTGFGLAIVERIAGGHGWNVSVAESEGGGARFEIEGVAVRSVDRGAPDRPAER